jgi:hypothetical protein
VTSIELCEQWLCTAVHAGSHFEARLHLQVLLTKNQLPDGSHDLPLSFETGPLSFDTGSAATDAALHHRQDSLCFLPVEALCVLGTYRELS